MPQLARQFQAGKRDEANAAVDSRRFFFVAV
jgi:hypothetical protein